MFINTSEIDLSAFTTEVSAPKIPLYYHAPFFTSLLNCNLCSIRPEAQRVVPGEGPQDAEIMVLGRNPGRQEDGCGRPFIPEAPGGEELNNWLQTLGLDRERILVTNSCHCHTKADRPPTVKELMICTETWLKQELEWFNKVSIIFTMGNDATKIVCGSDASSTGNLRPYKVLVRYNGDRTLSVFPLAHPGYLIRKRNLIPQMHQSVLPKIKEMLIQDHKDAYERARIQ